METVNGQTGNVVIPTVYIVRCSECDTETDAKSAVWYHHRPRCFECQKEYRLKLTEELNAMTFEEDECPELEFISEEGD
jgi:hypothetical protein